MTPRTPTARRIGRRHLALAAVAALLATPLAAVPAAADPSAPAAPPRTGFETSGGARWTSQAEEQSLLAAVDRDSDRVSVEQEGVDQGAASCGFGSRAEEGGGWGLPCSIAAESSGKERR
ncbi:hypothetical protein ACFYXM_02925 [Streptomyces sp. NPDC002476]|uniref:hypothetical protein n=1 Tax=Streptomyces sp. NPDC002476 TaxID=3364648 RepID=UPI00367B382B